MNFIVIGGGCYGTYYCRQLLRGAGKLGLEKITVVDHVVDCQVRREIDDPRICHITQDWHEFFLPYFQGQVEQGRAGSNLTDHYVPPCIGPHFIFELFESELKREYPGIQLNHLPMEAAIGTPLDMKLADGNRALSFAEWKCPHSCIEPKLCPVTRGEKWWDMGTYLTNYFEQKSKEVMQVPVSLTSAEGALRGRLHPRRYQGGVEGATRAPVIVESYHLLPCKHLAMGVGTIPMQLIIDEYLRFSQVVSQPGRHLAALATISSCHGLMGLLEVTS